MKNLLVFWHMHLNVWSAYRPTNCAKESAQSALCVLSVSENMSSDNFVLLLRKKEAHLNKCLSSLHFSNPGCGSTTQEVITGPSSLRGHNSLMDQLYFVGKTCSCVRTIRGWPWNFSWTLQLSAVHGKAEDDVKYKLKLTLLHYLIHCPQRMSMYLL